MNIVNIHERTLLTSPADAWRLIANLGSKYELLWPERWPKLRFDRALGLGACGGHGPIAYFVEGYVPGELLRCRFTRPRGFEGYHEFRIIPQLGSVTFRHTMRVRTHGLASGYWFWVLGPLHDALLEDLMDRASSYSSGHPFHTPWSLRVRFLRWLLRMLGSGRPPAPRAATVDSAR
ncbi:MAG TPA: SRPBCC family protein [Gammaproteobacteria bacterium]|nr:SRPBCC family protein [Gammaproteobacteria bacterium]